MSSFFNEPAMSIVPIVGKGSVNHIFLVETENTKVIIRLNNHHRALHDYQKESWCLIQATQKGIPSPKVLSVGKIDEYAYMIESFVAGTYGEDDSVDRLLTWRKLGAYVSVIETVQAEGFGENLSNPLTGQFTAPLHDGFDGTWNGFLSYNINSLTEEDKLVELGVLTNDQSKTVRNLFEKLYDYQFTLGLSHGDISLKNTIVSAEGEVYLLDWGSAEVTLAPFWDIIQVLKCHITQDNPTHEEYLAFIEGLGMSQDCYREHEPLINSLLLLRAIDKLRWAIARSPSDVPDFSAYAKTVLQRVLRTRE
ncbi:phosphotransferase [Alicyclobacillus fastidiosus]|uniref:Phosphotransferase n=1 Tax=Alicyclobacillus fastidiosus TaxID=392011 RepID=A0ABV5A9M8_9BACL|nr:phosphotransferase [Alicyclobacillus fastidiosus]WEH10903.1 phosphotransferase [Alicyclobacillus fastidiosus]